MAKSDLKEKDPIDAEEEQINARLDEVRCRQEEKRREKAIEASKATFKAKKDKLANRAAEFIIKYGKEDYRSQIMLTFLDVALQMEDAINLTHDVGTAMGCITEAIGCMDDILLTNELQIDGTLTTKHGFFARWKRKRKLQKAIRNNAGRMKQICDTLVGNQEMAQAIVNSLKKSSIKMQIMMQKNAEKQRKRELKYNPAARTTPSAAETLVDELVRAKAEENTDSPASSAPAAPSAPTKSGDGTVDISDI